MKKYKKIVAIMGGGDWYDATVEHLVIPKSLDLEHEYKLYRKWYKECYCKKYESETVASGEYMTFFQWLMKKGAEKPSEEDLVEFWDD